MSKQKWPWIMMILLLIISSPGIMMRWSAEQSNDVYEIMMPYEEIQTIDTESDATLDEILYSLKDAGLTTVSLLPLSLELLERQNVLSIYEESELAKQLHFTPFKDAVDIENEGYYISIPEEESYQNLIIENIQPEIVEIAGESFYFLPSTNENYDLVTPLGYDKTAIENIKSHGLNYSFKVENTDNKIVHEKIIHELLSYKDDAAHGLLSVGQEFLGYNQELGLEWLDQLYQSGYYFYTIEQHRPKGEYTIAKSTDFNLVRLHSIDVNKQMNLTLNESIDRTTRAVKERNIRTIFYHIRMTGNANDNLQEAIDYLEGVHERMPTHFTPGNPKLFDDITVSAWMMALVLLAGILFTYKTSELLKWMPLRIVAVALMSALAIAYFFLNKILILQVFALIIAVVTPTYAVIKTAKGTTRIVDLFIQYAKAIGISTIGIMIVIGLLNGNGFITGFEVFKGVKLVYIFPILGVLLFVVAEINLLSDKNLKTSLSNTLTLLNKEVKYWHILLMLLIAGVGLFYITRTGNSGSVSDLELAFRQWLENTLYVRPRTKEFLIGFPLFVLALYVMGINKKWGSIMLVPGVIGFLSTVNTFTHLHIPISVSILRTFYSVTLGFIMGLVLILLFRFVYQFISKVTARWS